MTSLERAKIGYRHPHDPGEPTTGKPRLSISDNEAEILSALAAGRLVLEIGTGLGVSTRALARYAERVFTIDPDPWVDTEIIPELVRDHPNVRALQDRYTGAGAMFDMAFIDGSHATDDVRSDLEYVAGLLYPDSLIVCHDARYPTVKLALGDDFRFIETEHVLAYRYVA